MPSTDYHFVTHWRVAGAIEEGYDIISDAKALTRWWPAVYWDVQVLHASDENGTGKTVSLYTKGRLPYTLRCQFRVNVIGVHPEIAAIIVERAIAAAEPFSNSSCFFPKNCYIFGNFVLNRIASIYKQKGAVAMANYSNPEVLVSTDWVDQHKSDPNVVLTEVDVDTTAYNEGHVPGAIGWNWQTQLCDTVRRDVISKADLEKLLGSSGVGNDTTVVLYGDNNNWFAAWAFWQLKMYGHKDVRLMNGGRKKWLAENRTLSKDAPTPKAKAYRAGERNDSLRAYLPQVQSAMKAPGYVMVDVRSPDEFSGKILSPPGLPETCQRGGHIPGAKSIPWAQACNEDGTFKSADDLKALYTGKGVTADKNVIAYCRIGERSSHSWFVLKYLLGYPNVVNYDGSWTEWGNLVNAPIERGA